MKRICFVNDPWTPARKNPFTSNGEYGNEWSAFIYDTTIQQTHNTFPGARVYTLRVPLIADQSFQCLRDFVTYEIEHGRNIIVKAPQPLRNIVKGALQQNLSENTPASAQVRPSDPRWLVHSTPAENWNQIKQMGALRSPASLKKRFNIQIKKLHMAPLEPADYEDYIMLDTLNGKSELAVASRSAGKICTDPDAPYTPGVRLYVKAHRLITEGHGVRDGFHPLKVRTSLSLKRYVRLAVTADLLPPQDIWTPNSFASAADRFFLEMTKHRGPHKIPILSRNISDE